MNPQPMIYLTYLAQVRQRRTSALLFPLKSVRTTLHTLLIKLMEKYGVLFKEIAIIGIVLSVELDEQNRNTGASLKVLEKWRSMDEFASSQSHAKEGD